MLGGPSGQLDGSLSDDFPASRQPSRIAARASDVLRALLGVVGAVPRGTVPTVGRTWSLSPQPAANSCILLEPVADSGGVHSTMQITHS